MSPLSNKNYNRNWQLFKDKHHQKFNREKSVKIKLIWRIVHLHALLLKFND